MLSSLRTGVGELRSFAASSPATTVPQLFASVIPSVARAVTGDFCPACAEVVLDREQGDRYSELIGMFQRQVNAAYVDPVFIANVRKKLSLDQREAGEIFGGGVNAFSRYENGKTKPPLALVKLLKVLDRHPDLLTEIRSA